MAQYAKVAGILGKGTGRFFTGIFKFKILFIFLFFIIANAVIIGVQQGDATATLIELGYRFGTPTLNLQQTSLMIIENEGLYKRTPDIFSGMLKVVWDIFIIISQFYIIILWIAVLAAITKAGILWDSSKKTSSYVLGILFFIGLQMVILSFTEGGDMMTPIYAFRDFFIAMPYIIQPIAGAADFFMEGKQELLGGGNQTIINETINNITI